MNKISNKIKQINTKLADTLIEKGVEASSEETTSSLVGKVAEIQMGEVPPGYIKPEGSMDINENGTFDVTEKAEVKVNVPSSDELFNTYLNMELTNFVVSKEVPKVRSYLFYKDTGIKTADLRNATNVGSEAFRDSSLEEVIFDDNFNSGGKIYFGARSFYNTQLVDVISTINVPITSASPSVFSNCLKLKNVYLPKLWLSGIKAFDGSSSLEKVVVMGGSFGGQNFLNCSSLTTLILLDDERISTSSNINNFTGTPIANGTGYIYVPKALIEEYKVATNWVTYASQFRAIEDYPEICGGAE